MEPEEKKVRIIIAEDHDIFALGLKVAIQTCPQYHVFEEVKSGTDLVEKAKATDFDLLIVDYVLPDISGLDAILEIRKVKPDTKSIIISSAKDPRLSTLFKEHGVNGYIFKSELRSTILVGISEVLAGKSYFSEPSEIAVKTYEPMDGPNPFKNLTPKELEVLVFIVKGFSNSEIGKKLDISTRTVETHKRNIDIKMDKLPRTQLARLAYLWKVVSDDELVSIHR
jgi:DNA-binding NarL/FixJ family response regulator